MYMYIYIYYTLWDALLFSFKVMMIAGTGVKMLQQTARGSARRRGQDGSEEIHGAVVTSFHVGHSAEMATAPGLGNQEADIRSLE